MPRAARLFLTAVLTVIVGSIVFSATATGQTGADWRFADPHSDMRMSINLQAVMKSPAVTELIRKAEADPQAQAQQAQMKMALGILSTVDRVSISARTAGKTPDALVLVTGSFDPAFVNAMFPSHGTSQVKQVGPHAVLLGEGVSFTQAVQRMAGAPAAAPFDELENSDIWIAGSSSAMSAQAATMPAGFKGLQQFSMGVTLSEAPEMNLILRASDGPGAAQMLSTLRELMGPMMQGAPAGLIDQAFQMKQDGAKVRVHFVAPPELMRMAQAQAAAGAFSGQLAPLMSRMGLSAGASAQPAAQPFPTTAPPGNGGKIMIYGLDDGPHEVKTK